MILNYNKSFLVFFILIISRFAPAFSQASDLYSYVREKHGYDLNLINGILYYDKYKNVLNHPFLSGENLLPGSIVFSGIRYEGLKFNYDIYSQYLILEYPAAAGSSYNIILSPEHTDAFLLDGAYFEKLVLDARGPLFYQVIKADGLACYIHWEKKKMTRSYQFQDYFTGPGRRCFLDYYGKLSPFSNRKNFVSLLSGVPKKEVKRFLRKNEIQIKNARPEQLEDILKFISSNIQSKTGN